MSVEVPNNVLQRVESELLALLSSLENELVDFFEFGDKRLQAEIAEKFHEAGYIFRLLKNSQAADICAKFATLFTNQPALEIVKSSEENVTAGFLLLMLLLETQDKAQINQSLNRVLARVEENDDASIQLPESETSVQEDALKATCQPASIALQKMLSEGTVTWESLYKISEKLLGLATTNEFYDYFWQISNLVFHCINQDLYVDEQQTNKFVVNLNDFCLCVAEQGEVSSLHAELAKHGKYLAVLTQALPRQKTKLNYNPPNARLTVFEDELSVSLAASDKTYDSIAFSLKSILSPIKDMIDSQYQNGLDITAHERLKSAMAEVRSVLYALNFNVGYRLCDEWLTQIEKKPLDYNLIAEYIVLIEDAIWQINEPNNHPLLEALGNQESHYQRTKFTQAAFTLARGKLVALCSQASKQLRENFLLQYKVADYPVFTNLAESIHGLQTITEMIQDNRLAALLRKAELLGLFAEAEVQLSQEIHCRRLYLDILVALEVVFDFYAHNRHLNEKSIDLLEEALGHFSNEIGFVAGRVAVGQYIETGFDDALLDGVLKLDELAPNVEYTAESQNDLGTMKQTESPFSNQVNSSGVTHSDLSEINLGNEDKFSAILEEVHEQQAYAFGTNEVVSSDAADEEMLDIFAEECQEIYNRLLNCTVVLQENIHDQEILIEMRRAYHTLKGSGRMVGLSVFGEFAYQHENLLNHLVSGDFIVNNALLTLFLISNDLIKQTVFTTPINENKRALLHQGALAAAACDWRTSKVITDDLLPRNWVQNTAAEVISEDTSNINLEILAQITHSVKESLQRDQIDDKSLMGNELLKGGKLSDISNLKTPVAESADENIAINLDIAHSSEDSLTIKQMREKIDDKLSELAVHPALKSNKANEAMDGLNPVNDANRGTHLMAQKAAAKDFVNQPDSFAITEPATALEKETGEITGKPHDLSTLNTALSALTASLEQRNIDLAGEQKPLHSAIMDLIQAIQQTTDKAPVTEELSHLAQTLTEQALLNGMDEKVNQFRDVMDLPVPYGEILDSLYGIENGLNDIQTPDWTWEALSALEDALMQKNSNETPTKIEQQKIKQALDSIVDSLDLEESLSSRFKNNFLQLRADLLTGNALGKTNRSNDGSFLNFSGWDEKSFGSVLRDIHEAPENEISFSREAGETVEQSMSSYQNWHASDYLANEHLNSLRNKVDRIKEKAKQAGYQEAYQVTQPVSDKLNELESRQLQADDLTGGVIGEVIQEIKTAKDEILVGRKASISQEKIASFSKALEYHCSDTIDFTRLQHAGLSAGQTLNNEILSSIDQVELIPNETTIGSPENQTSAISVYQSMFIEETKNTLEGFSDWQAEDLQPTQTVGDFTPADEIPSVIDELRVAKNDIESVKSTAPNVGDADMAINETDSQSNLAKIEVETTVNKNVIDESSRHLEAVFSDKHLETDTDIHANTDNDGQIISNLGGGIDRFIHCARDKIDRSVHDYQGWKSNLFHPDEFLGQLQISVNLVQDSAQQKSYQPVSSLYSQVSSALNHLCDKQLVADDITAEAIGLAISEVSALKDLVLQAPAGTRFDAAPNFAVPVVQSIQSALSRERLGVPVQSETMLHDMTTIEALANPSDQTQIIPVTGSVADQQKQNSCADIAHEPETLNGEADVFLENVIPCHEHFNHRASIHIENSLQKFEVWKNNLYYPDTSLNDLHESVNEIQNSAKSVEYREISTLFSTVSDAIERLKTQQLIANKETSKAIDDALSEVSLANTEHPLTAISQEELQRIREILMREVLGDRTTEAINLATPKLGETVNPSPGSAPVLADAAEMSADRLDSEVLTDVPSEQRTTTAPIKIVDEALFSIIETLGEQTEQALLKYTIWKKQQFLPDTSLAALSLALQGLSSLDKQVSEWGLLDLILPLDQALVRLKARQWQADTLTADAIHSALTEIQAFQEGLQSESGDKYLAEEIVDYVVQILNRKVLGKTLLASETVSSEQVKIDRLHQPRDVQSNDTSQLDETILDIFLDEATLLHEKNQESFSLWRADYTNLVEISEMQRNMHTLKGGARMAELNVLGDLVHQLESLLELIVSDRAQRLDEAAQLLERGNAVINEIIDVAKINGIVFENKTFLANLNQFIGDTLGISKMDLTEMEMALQASAPLTIPNNKETALLAQLPSGHKKFTVRLDNTVLEKISYLIGEDSILRARTERLLNSTNNNVFELDGAGSKIAEQLSRLTTATETQILFRRDNLTEKNSDFDPLELDRFSEIQQFSRSLAESVDDLLNLLRLVDDNTLSARGIIQDQKRIQQELQSYVLSAQMVRFDSIVPRLERIIYQVSEELGKQVDLFVYGGQIEIERAIFEDILSGFEHTIRNAITHGIEASEERQQKGKPERGQIRIGVNREGSNIWFMIADDGRGVDYKKVIGKARSLGMLDEQRQEDKDYILSLLFEQGLSTMDKATQLAGRGIGMDVLKNVVTERNGTISIETQADKGLAISIKIPFKASVTDALLVHIGVFKYAIPVGSIEGVSRIDLQGYERFCQGESVTMTYGQNKYGLRSLSKLLNVEVNKTQFSDFGVPILLAKVNNRRIAFEISDIIDREEIIIKSVSKQLMSLPGIVGATLLEGGEAVPVLDISRLDTLLAQSQELIEKTLADNFSQDSMTVPTKLKVLVVDDSITMRRATSKVLGRYDVEYQMAKDGVDAVEILESYVPDVILLDIEMPRMDGFEFASYVRNLDNFTHLAIIMITSRTGDKHRERAKKIGINDYLGKPYTEDVLVAAIERITGKRLQRQN